MAHHDVIVIGASGGGIEPLTTLLGGLPPTLAAAVFVVVHIRPDAPSYLPSILNRAGALPAAHAVDGEPIRQGRVYVAPPGQQIYLHSGRITVSRGPRENMHRPAIDPLFRTAAHYYRNRVIGVILSGAMDDGSAGLLAIKEAGGVAVVQDPADATIPGMPMHAMEAVAVDYSVKSDDLAALMISLVDAPAERGSEFSTEVPLETTEEAAQPDEAHSSDELGPPSMFTCPDCQGTLFEVHDGTIVRYRCRVGHGYSAEAMDNAQGEAVERALWAAQRALEERVGLIKKMADQARRNGHAAVAMMFESRAADVNKEVQAIHRVIAASQALEPVGQEEG